MNLPLIRPCQCCGGLDNHAEDCPAPEHQAMLAGHPLSLAVHDPDQCELCLLTREVTCRCRCGNCCERLILEATAFDARHEPRIRERCGIIDEGGLLSPEEAGWLLNGPKGPCVFFHRDVHGQGVCEIYDTRPLMCRLYDCDHQEQEGDDP